MTIAAEGLRKLVLKPISIIYSLDTHILVAKIFVYLVCFVLAKMVNSVVKFHHWANLDLFESHLVMYVTE